VLSLVSHLLLTLLTFLQELLILTYIGLIQKILPQN